MPQDLGLAEQETKGSIYGNQPAKVACHALVPIVKSEDLTDTDEDLETFPVLDKRSTPMKPCGSSLGRCNKPVAGPITVHGGKLLYDPITAMKMRQERQDTPRIKRDPHAGVVYSGSSALASASGISAIWLVRSFPKLLVFSYCRVINIIKLKLYNDL
jgi:hypothetical protein